MVFKLSKYCFSIALIIFPLLTFTGCSNKKGYAASKNDSLVMFSAPLKSFEYKPLGELLNATNNVLIGHAYEDEPPGHLNGVYLIFDNGVCIKAEFNVLRFVPPISETLDWNFELIKKESAFRYSYCDNFSP